MPLEKEKLASFISGLTQAQWNGRSPVNCKQCKQVHKLISSMSRAEMLKTYEVDHQKAT